MCVKEYVLILVSKVSNIYTSNAFTGFSSCIGC